MRERLKVDETTWAYVGNLRAVCIVRRGLRPHERRSRGTEGKPPDGLRAQLRARPTICYAGRLISHRRVQTCGVGLFLCIGRYR